MFEYRQTGSRVGEGGGGGRRGGCVFCRLEKCIELPVFALALPLQFFSANILANAVFYVPGFL